MVPIEREAQTVPLRCYALEFDATDPRCQKCRWFQACRTDSGPSASQVTLHKAKFSLSAPGSKHIQQEAANVGAIYAMAHRRVFSKNAKESVEAAEQAAVILAAKDAGATVETYIYSCLLGHKISCPERRFKPSYLLGATAAKRVKFFRDRAVSRYGTFDAQAILQLANKPQTIAPVKEAIAASERMFARWIVGERLKRGGNGVNSLYTNRELSLSPYWLATESTYFDWLKTQPQKPSSVRVERYPGTPEAVTQLVPDEYHSFRNQVKHVPEAALPELLTVRSEALMPIAVDILREHGLGHTAVRIQTPVTSAFQFWLGLGSALLQHQLLFTWVYPR